MDHPKTDILVLVHNNLPLTKRFTDLLLKHTSNYDLTFIDNGSTDDVKNYLLKGAIKDKWQIYRSETNLGIINGRNLAARMVKSDYFVNLDNDQLVCDGWLLKLHQKMKLGYDIVGVEAWCLYPPNSGQMKIGDKLYKRDYFPMRQCKNPTDKFTYVGCGGMLIKKSVYDAIGLFDERFNPCFFEDPDLVFRCIKQGYKVGWEPKTGIIHLAHQTTNNQKTFERNKQLIQSWEKFKDKWYPYFPPALKS